MDEALHLTGAKNSMFKSVSTRQKIFGGACLALLAGAFCRAAFEFCLVGKFSFEVISEPAASSFLDPDFRVAILRSEYTARFLGATAPYEAHVQYWRKLAQSLHVSSDFISDAQLERGLAPYRGLVLPSAVCLSERERANIRAFLEGGGGLICTWATGARNEKGEWRGWDFVRELTGADRIEPEERTSPWFIAFTGVSPITVGLAEGARAQVDSPERVKATALNVDGYWSDARLFPVDSAQPSNFQGAALHRQLGRGRVVWYGFQENSAVAGGNDQAIVDAALINGLAWAGHAVVDDVDPWPFPYSAAAVLALETDEDYENATYAADAILKSQGRGTFFCAADVVKKNPELLGTLKRAGELAVQGDSNPPPTQSWMAAQLARAEVSRWKLRRLAGTWASGCVCPEPALTSETIRALTGAGYRYCLSSHPGGSVRPTAFQIVQRLWVFSRELSFLKLVRMTDDDLHFSPQGIGGLDPQWIVRRVLADFEIVGGLGGLYVLGYHTRGLSAPQYAGALSQLIEQWKHRGTWITTADEVAGWWMKRSQLSVHVSGEGQKSLRVTVVSQAAEPLEGASLSIYPPVDSFQARVVPVGRQTYAPQVVPDPSNARIRLLLGKLEPGRALTYEIDFNR